MERTARTLLAAAVVVMTAVAVVIVASKVFCWQMIPAALFAAGVSYKYWRDKI